MSRFRSSSKVLLVLVPLLRLFVAAPADGDYRTSFRRGVLAMERSDWADAAHWMREAIRERPQESQERIHLYGSRRQPYLPYFFLGRSLFEMGEHAVAAEALRESVRQGAVQREKRQLRELRRYPTLLSLVPALSRVSAVADYRMAFRRGISAIERGEFGEGVYWMREAIRERPQESQERVYLYGSRFCPYLPHFFLGQALFELGHYAAAAEALRESARQGAIQHEYRHLRRLERYRAISP